MPRFAPLTLTPNQSLSKLKPSRRLFNRIAFNVPRHVPVRRPGLRSPGPLRPCYRSSPARIRQTRIVPDHTTRAKRYWRFGIVVPVLAKLRRKKFPGLPPPPVRPARFIEPRLNAPGVRSPTVLFLFQDHANVRPNERRGKKRATVGDHTGHGRSFLPDGHRRAGHRTRGQPQIGGRQEK